VSVAVAWQASALATFSLLVGLPLGVASGRWLWTLLASRLGVGTNPQMPLVTLLLAAPITLAVANMVAAGPGWVAGRLKPAIVLRTE
jgi:ABC-type antimicrobial peptide transport system permease subunit